MSPDEFKTIPEYNNYSINGFGVVINKSGHILTPTLTKLGPAVILWSNGQRERLLVVDLLKKVGESSESV